MESYPNHSVQLGNIPVSRALPVRGRRTVGPWCFIDRFGPMSFGDDKPMDVASHPHIGLQTVTWLLDGEILHDDSLGCESVARPGGVNVMTAGSGIAHAEQTPKVNSHRLDGVQLWVALPDAYRNIAAAFQAVERVPLIEQPGGIVQVFAGSLVGAVSPAVHYSGIVGADLNVHEGQSLEVGLDAGCEHALVVLQGDVALEGQPLAPQQLHYLGVGRASLALRSSEGARVLLIGGPPFGEKVLLWWNFAARTLEEMAAARADWENHRRFGEVTAYRGARLSAPELIRFAH
jgi:quercetin 2,3-dioxygenase